MNFKKVAPLLFIFLIKPSFAEEWKYFYTSSEDMVEVYLDQDRRSKPGIFQELNVLYNFTEKGNEEYEIIKSYSHSFNINCANNTNKLMSISAFSEPMGKKPILKKPIKISSFEEWEPTNRWLLKGLIDDICLPKEKYPIPRERLKKILTKNVN